MVNGQEYEVVKINEKKKRYISNPYGHNNPPPPEGFKFLVENRGYRIIYINEGKKWMTIEPLGNSY